MKKLVIMLSLSLLGASAMAETKPIIGKEAEILFFQMENASLNGDKSIKDSMMHGGRITVYNSKTAECTATTVYDEDGNVLPDQTQFICDIK